MLALVDGERRHGIIDKFRITEIGDDGCITLFCPTKQTAFSQVFST
ncbi:hypothetical protein I6F21_00800 [Bradyrhizobium sp. NBAIM03]|nr:hypothetical protein [Bradyrhizobium sp. NBAIM03]MCA1531094.1 hypothetical protein [Bradyrhizobium sp. NBAIM03]